MRNKQDELKSVVTSLEEFVISTDEQCELIKSYSEDLILGFPLNGVHEEATNNNEVINRCTNEIQESTKKISELISKIKERMN